MVVVTGTGNGLPSPSQLAVWHHLKILYWIGFNSTRLFKALPSAVSLLAVGLENPKPIDESRPGSIPFFKRYSMTAFARFSESF